MTTTDYLTVSDAARTAGVSRSTISRWCAGGQGTLRPLRAEKVSGVWLVDSSDLAGYQSACVRSAGRQH
jgi:predicted site-specific integrase-resolvase